MIDFKDASFLKLRRTDNNSFSDNINSLLISGEKIISTFKGVRDGVVFTSHRLITVNVQGITGKKQDYTYLPYSKIQAFSVETSGTFDLDSELELWFSGLGKVKLEFTGSTNIKEIGMFISQRML